MKYTFILFTLLISGVTLTSQNLNAEMLYPDTLRSTQDSFSVNSPKFSTVWTHPISKDDTLNLGTSGYEGVSMTIWTDIDTLSIPHMNYPFKQLIKIPIASPSDTTMCILRFQANNSNFDDQYTLNNTGAIKFEIPETYELANVILYLSECSEKTGNRPDSEYANQVRKYFEPFRQHKLIQVLNNNCNEHQLWGTYYGFRENSLAFRFDDTTLQYDTPYKHLSSDNSGIRGGQFRNMLYLIQEFASTSNFRTFYQNNLGQYKNMIERQEQLLPIDDMWKWVENEFPQRLDAYKIVFSPLIGGSHSTRHFYTGFFKNPDFQECIMFINSSEDIDSRDYSENLKEGLMSGIVFTEIDHNYVNPTSDEHIIAIQELINDKDHWATKKAQQNYRNEYAIFNEYMTHSLFCLYVQDKYESTVRDEIIDKREKLMERRGYKMFKEFNEILLNKMATTDSSVYDNYADIIEEMKRLQ